MACSFLSGSGGIAWAIVSGAGIRSLEGQGENDADQVAF